MNERNKTEKLILEHFKRYPNMQAQDLFKFLFQSAFGCEHMISSLSRATDYLISEYNSQKTTDALIEQLDGNYSRVHLGVINNGLNATTFAKLFFLSAKKEENGLTNLKNNLALCKNLIESGKLPLPKRDFYNLLEQWEKANYPAIHHSDEYRNCYHPCYRVIANDFVFHLDFFTKIDIALNENKNGTITLESDNVSIKKESDLNILRRVYDGLTFDYVDNLPNKKSALIIIKR